MDFKLEVATVPVSDVERSLAFYSEKVGFTVDIDMTTNGGARLVQLTPPGSTCSIHLGTTTTNMKPGSVDSLFLVVTDVRAARNELLERGLDVGDLQIFDEGSYRPADEDENLDYVGCVFIEDPDGNEWIVQQVPPRS